MKGSADTDVTARGLVNQAVRPLSDTRNGRAQRRRDGGQHRGQEPGARSHPRGRPSTHARDQLGMLIDVEAERRREVIRVGQPAASTKASRLQTQCRPGRQS
ncbi:MAG TPA: hypothetical protein VKF59_15350 [Candidatus Dormibacteraeota bacterium]|nr:hypothetical protein [Candidatus Dormibacteraeota bacterium]